MCETVIDEDSSTVFVTSKVMATCVHVSRWIFGIPPCVKYRLGFCCVLFAKIDVSML